MYRWHAGRTLNPYPHRRSPQVVITVTPSMRAQALFASCLQPSEHPTPDQVTAAVRHELRRRGGAVGCAAAVAAEYGEHPEAAAARMRWALAMTVTRGVLAGTAAA